MMEFVLDSLAERDQGARSEAELHALRRGILAFLRENAISPEETGSYHRRFVSCMMDRIAREDLRAYLIHFEEIRDIRCAVLSYRSRAEALPPERRARCLAALTRLYEAKLGARYLPGALVQRVLKVQLY